MTDTRRYPNERNDPVGRKGGSNGRVGQPEIAAAVGNSPTHVLTHQPFIIGFSTDSGANWRMFYARLHRAQISSCIKQEAELRVLIH